MPCKNCGNCHREYTQEDMTAEAKWVINCIAETKGRYGQNIVMGMLLGANRARLKEIGASSYKSYGVLSDKKEKELRMLINEMLMEGYVIQTADEYSVLKIGDITRLRDGNARVIIRKFVEKEETASARERKARSTDVLTSAGFDLFEKLRQLRLEIAKEEAMPPYIIFSDKTLVDMCAKAPVDKEGMLAVSGVGENKFQKYGQRFIDAIAAFTADNPDAVISTTADEDIPVTKNVKQNAGTSWTNEEDDVLRNEFQSGMKIAEIAKAHGRTNGAIRARLKKHGLLE